MNNPKKLGDQDGPGNLQKDPDDWVTGDEAMTMAQASYLKTLSEEAGEDFDDSLTKADASKRIDELQLVTGRGRPAQPAAHEAAPTPPHAAAHADARRPAHSSRSS